MPLALKKIPPEYKAFAAVEEDSNNDKVGVSNSHNQFNETNINN